MAHVNSLLREQLDKATAANQKLASDLHRYAHMKEEYEAREAEWKKEEQVNYPPPPLTFSLYFNT